jgi:LysR family glycine cleavage system transcriptional activator
MRPKKNMAGQREMVREVRIAERNGDMAFAHSTRSVRMPSLNAIRAFEAVGRLLSYQRASQELHVTPSAVSHQIKALEDYFRIPLVLTVNRQIRLTPAGEKYFRQISQGMTQLSRASMALLQGKGDRVLRISTPPTFATWWMIPRLEKFFSAFPDFSLRISADPARVDLALGQYDAAIRYARTVESGLHAARLSQNHIFPVCSPTLVDGSHPLRTVADLEHHALIFSKEPSLTEDPIADWGGWLKANRYPQIPGRRHLILSPQGVMLQAVSQGLGVGLARTLLAAGAMAVGQLVCPFGPALASSANYYLVCPQANATDPDIAAFRDWLIAEASASAALIEIPTQERADVFV